MTNITPLLPHMTEPDPDVVFLRCPDQLHFDPKPLKHLFAHKAAPDAEEIVCCVLEVIAMRLDVMQTEMAQNAFDKIPRPANQIKVVADQIGLKEVVVSVSHVASCVQQRDGIALKATMARLERAFDRAVSEVWNFRDY